MNSDKPNFWAIALLTLSLLVVGGLATILAASDYQTYQCDHHSSCNAGDSEAWLITREANGSYRAAKESSEHGLISDERWIAIGTGGLFVATLLLFGATLGLWITTSQSLKKQANDVERQLAVATEAAEAASASSDAYKQTQRAWLSQWDVTVTPWGGVDTDGAPVALHAVVVWRNGGSTPAVRTKAYKQGARVAPEARPQSVIFLKPADEQVGVTVGPTKTIHTAPFAITVEDLQKSFAGERKVLMWSRVEYEDIFHPGQQHAEEAIIQVEVLALGGTAEEQVGACRFQIVGGKSEGA